MIRKLLIIGLFASTGCSQSEADSAERLDPNRILASEMVKITVVSPTKGLAYYPCEECHRHAEDGAGTVVNSHSGIRLKHMPGAQCNTCHDPAKPGQLKLASGATFKLEDVHQLCGQCHSREVSDWQVGVHGKQVGNWQTEIHRFACTSCHDPHRPSFGSMIALPAPVFPRLGIPKGNH